MMTAMMRLQETIYQCIFISLSCLLPRKRNIEYLFRQGRSLNSAKQHIDSQRPGDRQGESYIYNIHTSSVHQNFYMSM